VKKGLEADGKVEVYGNIKPGDQVVLHASDEIRDGSTVKY
jgi:hypothetical protein